MLQNLFTEYKDTDLKSGISLTLELTGAAIEGDNIADLRKTLQSMLWCLDKEIVDEI